MAIWVETKSFSERTLVRTVWSGCEASGSVIEYVYYVIYSWVPFSLGRLEGCMEKASVSADLGSVRLGVLGRLIITRPTSQHLTVGTRSGVLHSGY